MNKYIYNKKAFSLVEILLAVTLFAIVSTSLYLSMQSGIGIYRKITLRNKVLHNINKFFRRIESDLNNAIVLPDNYFLGDKNNLSFAGLVEIEDKDMRVKKIASISYEIRNNSIIGKIDFNDKKYKKIKNVYLAGKVKNISFKYAFFDEDEKVLWEKRWDGEEYKEIPRVIKIKLDLNDGKNIEKEIFIPNGRMRGMG